MPRPQDQDSGRAGQCAATRWTLAGPKGTGISPGANQPALPILKPCCSQARMGWNALESQLARVPSCPIQGATETPPQLCVLRLHNSAFALSSLGRADGFALGPSHSQCFPSPQYWPLLSGSGTAVSGGDRVNEDSRAQVSVRGARLVRLPCHCGKTDRPSL